MELVIFAALFWVLPIIVGHQIAKSKNRGNLGWGLGLVLGWLGVIIMACLKPEPEPQGLIR